MGSGCRTRVADGGGRTRVADGGRGTSGDAGHDLEDGGDGTVVEIRVPVEPSATALS